MKRETLDWIAKAEGDFYTATRERDIVENPNFDAVCFHSQQCAEKYLKAKLIEESRSFPKIHDLDALLRLVLPLIPELASLDKGLRQLTSMAVEVRYPGMSADKEDADIALRVAKDTRKLARRSLGIKK